jgi:hypothetical protein
MLPPSVHESAGRRRLKNTPLMSAVAKALKRAGRASRYRLRQQVVEPVFGQMRQARGFRQFPVAGPRSGPRRVGHDLHRPQPPQARPSGRPVRHARSARRPRTHKDTLLGHAPSLTAS